MHTFSDFFKRGDFMLSFERQEQIISCLQAGGCMPVKALAAAIFVSEATIRRDVAELESRGLVRRVYGGVMLSSYKNEVVPVDIRDSANSAEKEQAARQAAALIGDNETVIFDSSSTVRRICKHIRGRKNLTVITNNLRVCNELKDTEVTVYCTGGVLKQRRECFMGSYAVEFLASVQADSVFFSCQGISEDGVISDSSEEEVALRRCMIARAKKQYFLCDSSKLGVSRTFSLCNAADLTAVICGEDYSHNEE